jgi:SNF2 family DNA or RNA helicase
VLISSDAGGFGIDLPQANLLVNVDLPWSSGTAQQRNSRIIRASSTWPQIRIDRFLMDRSLELRQWEALTHKNAVSTAVVDGTGFNDKGGVTTSVESLRSILSMALA